MAQEPWVEHKTHDETFLRASNKKFRYFAANLKWENLRIFCANFFWLKKGLCFVISFFQLCIPLLWGELCLRLEQRRIGFQYFWFLSRDICTGVRYPCWTTSFDKGCVRIFKDIFPMLICILVSFEFLSLSFSICAFQLWQVSSKIKFKTNSLWKIQYRQKKIIQIAQNFRLVSFVGTWSLHQKTCVYCRLKGS